MAETVLIYGIHAVAAVLERRPGDLLEVWADERRRDRPLGALVETVQARQIPLRSVDRAALDDMLPGARHQGIVARVRVQVPGREEALRERLRGLDHAPLLLVLDGVQDPHNLGACLRSADAAGVDAVVVPRDRAVGLTATVRKVASGAAETVPLIQVTNLARTLRELQDQGLWVAGLAGEADNSLYDLDLTGPLALVLGAEDRGLRRLTRETCDWLARIPMHGSVESLNVSVAAGVCLFEALRQRTRSNHRSA